MHIYADATENKKEGPGTVPRDAVPADLLRKGQKRVLIVDDDPATVRLLKRLIEAIDPHIEIAVAFTGLAGGQQLKLFRPHLILLDLLLPGLDGFNVCKNIRNENPNPDVKIIAISGLTSEETEARILENGADRFVHKPFNPTALREMIIELLNLD
jgi:DNA-binding response OmpR family regulator